MTFYWICFPAFHVWSPEPFDPRFQAFSGSVVVNYCLWHPPRSHSSPASGSTKTTMKSMWNQPAFKWNQGEKVVCQTLKTDVSYFSVSNWILTLVKFKFLSAWSDEMSWFYVKTSGFYLRDYLILCPWLTFMPLSPNIALILRFNKKNIFWLCFW